jgi:hypothetical protein
MYGTDWCGVCKVSRAFMDEKGIIYYEYDIEKSSEGEKQYTPLGGNGPLCQASCHPLKSKIWGREVSKLCPIIPVNVKQWF